MQKYTICTNYDATKKGILIAESLKQDTFILYALLNRQFRIIFFNFFSKKFVIVDIIELVDKIPLKQKSAYVGER